MRLFGHDPNLLRIRLGKDLVYIEIGPELVREQTRMVRKTSELVCNWPRKQQNWSERARRLPLQKMPGCGRPRKGRTFFAFRVRPLKRYVYSTPLRGPNWVPWIVAIAQLYLGSMTFFAARQARAASGSAWRLSSPQLRL